jgi:hypothetical protein
VAISLSPPRGQCGTLPRLRSRPLPRQAAAPASSRCGQPPPDHLPRSRRGQGWRAAPRPCRCGASSRRAHDRATSLILVLTFRLGGDGRPRRRDAIATCPCLAARATAVRPAPSCRSHGEARSQEQCRYSAVDCSTDARARRCAVTSLRNAASATHAIEGLRSPVLEGETLFISCQP